MKSVRPTVYSRHIVLSFDGARRESGLGVVALILWLPNEYGILEVSYGGCLLRNASAMVAEREAPRKGIEHFDSYFRQKLVRLVPS